MACKYNDNYQTAGTNGHRSQGGGTDRSVPPPSKPRVALGRTGQLSHSSDIVVAHLKHLKYLHQPNYHTPVRLGTWTPGHEGNWAPGHIDTWTWRWTQGGQNKLQTDYLWVFTVQLELCYDPTASNCEGVEGSTLDNPSWPVKVVRPTKTILCDAASPGRHSWRAATMGRCYQECHWKELPEAVWSWSWMVVPLSNFVFNFIVYIDNVCGNIDQRTTHVWNSLTVLYCTVLYYTVLY